MDAAAIQESQPKMEAVDYQTDPSRYRHWKLAKDGHVATLTMDVSEEGGIRPGYKLKLNSYDLGVDIELHDAIQRLRFEHPEIRTVVITSGKNRDFLFRRKHLYAGTFQSRVESEFLQIHE